jgi:nucleotide-binding universal stress UspA family protein
MAKRILVPLDGSPLAATALAHAISIVPPEEAQITLLRVVERNGALAGVDPLDWHLQRSEAQTYLDQTRDKLAEFLPAPPETILLEGRAADRIVEHARGEGYDLLVFTSHGRGGLTGWNMSSVASKIAVRAVMSILLVRSSTAATAPAPGMVEPLRYRRILVPLDGSQRAEHVLPMASALAEQHDAELVLLHVVVRPELIQRMPLTDEEIALVEQVVQRNRCQAQEYFAQLGSRLAVQPETHILTGGDVAGTLHRFAAEQAVDLVLLSAHGYTGHRQWAYGSLVTSFLTHGTTSLLILQDMPWQTTAPEEAELTAQTWKEEGLLATHMISNFGEARVNYVRTAY